LEVRSIDGRKEGCLHLYGQAQEKEETIGGRKGRDNLLAAFIHQPPKRQFNGGGW
jgi:hypothetical protein